MVRRCLGSGFLEEGAGGREPGEEGEGRSNRVKRAPPLFINGQFWISRVVRVWFKADRIRDRLDNEREVDDRFRLVNGGEREGEARHWMVRVEMGR